MKYDFAKIESKWQKKWADADLFAAKDNSDKPKFYGLVEFPYPSGAGMHVGHIKAYSGLEVVSRKRRMQGYMFFSQLVSMHSAFLQRITPSRLIHIQELLPIRTLIVFPIR